MSAESSRPMRQFPAAPHPEIMRADEKDSQYVKQLCDACHDAFCCIFGEREAIAYENETKLAGQALYFFLTTGLGVQTPGEEYSNMSQVAGQSGLPLNPARRTLLVFLQTVVPYVAERLRQGISRASQETILSQLSGTDASSTEVSSSIDLVAVQPSRSLRLQLQRIRLQVLQYWPVVLPFIKEALPLLSRANLMLFYFKGVYYDVAKRVAGVQYALLAKPPQQRTRYHMLGIFLLIQLCVTGSNWLWQNVIPVLATSLQPHSVSQSVLKSSRQGVQILDEEQKPISNAYWLHKSDMSRASTNALEHMKCTLCLGSVKFPTATPCGHVFCWDCVAECCNQKPECPLCRSDITHSELVPIYNAEF